MSSEDKWNSNSDFWVIFFLWEKFSAMKEENNFGEKYYLQFQGVKKNNGRRVEECVLM